MSFNSANPLTKINLSLVRANVIGFFAEAA